ncbi:disulfide oxidoreductase [Paramagnetospirillum marisnigri]|uniref:Disulfide oxidoreductase n=1 Tax=Paramagnetospirillum marisnigri TaxID=1285242 RepID=A0A178MNF4_9PROT|nr:helicase-related protein [Paramagnetospirillum marisnigri]OAN50209.1 disulfide oxidoreductase [Paramagnetospirillum marisnigri]
MTTSRSAASASPGRLTAVLGPTNTGKTHLALERMLGHASGMIGFPLRLLARENYERIVRLKGAGSVALITGEEKIVPPHPRWFVCTVESMPLDRRVAFLAVDEIQLCADPERGHIFTDRLLHARGEQETMVLGAETIKPLLRRLVPGVDFISRPRFSSLIHVGPRKLNRLPPRSVVVAFSAAEVYAMAESVRRSRGGAAVVLGALSPRTRNAQVAMYQAGEVDYIVATDAIGMGLNMDVDHVAFAALRKFDGRAPRPLEPPELAQIAGRAGRHMNDGSFGTTADAGTIPPDMVEAIENHRFAPLKLLSWRNSDLRFASVAALLASLDKPAPLPGLIRAREADDHTALAALSLDADIARLANHPDRVRLLWEVCQIPDFRKVLDESHTRLLGRVFTHLAAPAGRLPTDWVVENVRRIDRTDGELDTIVARIAQIRTWTYMAHRPDWMADPGHWQELTRAIEDRLSDALHDRLTNRFVDKRTAHLTRRLRDGGGLEAGLSDSGEVRVDGHVVGRLDGFVFVSERADSAGATRTLQAAALRALTGEVAERLRRIAEDPPEAFTLAADGLRWRGALVASLSAGADILRPRPTPLASDLLDPSQRDGLRRRLDDVCPLVLGRDLAPLFRLRAAPLTGAARGLAHQLVEGLGSAPLADCRVGVEALDAAGRGALTRLGVRFGTESVFLPLLLKPAALQARAQLWGIAQGLTPPPSPAPRPAVADPGWPPGFAEAVGYRLLGGIAVRLDILERFAAETRALARAGAEPNPDEPSRLMASLLSLGLDAARSVRAALSRRAKGANRPRPRPVDPDSPFAVLKR